MARRHFLIPLALVIVATSISVAVYATNPTSAIVTGSQPVGVLKLGGKFSTTQSCAAAGCHGSGQIGKAGGEHSTWQDGDPHTNAFQVLYNDDSVRISKNLGRDLPAYKDASCLACHAINHDRHHTNGELLDDRTLTEGVACESCHGASQKWLTEHYLPSWKSLSDREKFERYDFVPTKDTVARTLTCAQCHVGGRDREVNHDLIAAGHPRLSFEYTRYHYKPNYLKHWQEKLPNPQFEVQAWLIGQVTALRSAVDLLAVRAERSRTKQSPWPELSESSCYSCHQNLSLADLRSSATKTQRPRPRGVAGWQVWYSSFSRALPKLAAIVQPSQPGLATMPNLEQLRREMEKPQPNASTVQKLASLATAELDVWLTNFQTGGFVPLSVDQVRSLAAVLTENVYDASADKLRDYDWDFFAQHSLGLVALYHASGGASNAVVAGWKPSLLDLQSKLAFEKSGNRVDSPRDFKPDSVYDAFRALHQLTH